MRESFKGKSFFRREVRARSTSVGIGYSEVHGWSRAPPCWKSSIKFSQSCHVSGFDGAAADADDDVLSVIVAGETLDFEIGHGFDFIELEV